MSGVYIKGMEMPVTCCHCAFMYFDPDATNSNNGNLGSYLCSFTKDEIWNTQRDPACPLIPVPDHGDLIDRDALNKRIKEETINQAEFYADRWHPVVLAYGDCYGKVQNAPAVIPADRKE